MQIFVVILIVALWLLTIASGMLSYLRRGRFDDVTDDLFFVAFVVNILAIVWSK